MCATAARSRRRLRRGEQRAERVDRPASVVREERISARLVDLTVRSRALGTTAMVRLMTPAGWSREAGARRWPVLYLLHGCCDTYESWTRSTAVERMPELRGVLVVIAGLSMGGLGAMGYAARHPGVFAAAASFSGVLHPLADADNLMGLFAQYGDPGAIWGDPRRDRGVWSRHDPTELAPMLRGMRLFVSSGTGAPGRFDPPDVEPDPIERSVMRQSRAFAGRLEQLEIPVESDFYGAGTHTWPYWQRELERALPLLLGD